MCPVDRLPCPSSLLLQPLKHSSGGWDITLPSSSQPAWPEIDFQWVPEHTVQGLGDYPTLCMHHWHHVLQRQKIDLSSLLLSPQLTPTQMCHLGEWGPAHQVHCSTTNTIMWLHGPKVVLRPLLLLPMLPKVPRTSPFTLPTTSIATTRERNLAAPNLVHLDPLTPMPEYTNMCPKGRHIQPTTATTEAQRPKDWPPWCLHSQQNLTQITANNYSLRH